MFRCESLTLKSHWVMVVMDQCTRRIIGFGIHAGVPRWPRDLSDVRSCHRGLRHADILELRQ